MLFSPEYFENNIIKRNLDKKGVQDRNMNLLNENF